VLATLARSFPHRGHFVKINFIPAMASTAASKSDTVRARKRRLPKCDPTVPCATVATANLQGERRDMRAAGEVTHEPRRDRWQAAARLGKNRFHNIRLFDPSEALVETAEGIGKPGVVDPQSVEDGGV
jgi:hypothetical protein